MPNRRRLVTRSLPPMWLMGVCLFVPTVRACEKLESPASLLVGAKPFFVALLAPYLVVQLIVILAIVALARGQVSSLVTRATTLLAVAAGASAAQLAVTGFGGRRLGEHAWSLFAAVCFVVAVGVIVRARALEPWARLGRLHAAYAIFTLPLAALLARIVVEDGPHKVGWGAFVFLAAYGALAAVHAPALARARDPVSSSTA